MRSNKGLEKRVKTLEDVVGASGDLYILRIIFHHTLFPPSKQYCEVRWLMKGYGADKTYIRTLEGGELLTDAEGGLDPWETNPHYDPTWKHGDPYPEPSAEEKQAEEERIAEIRRRMSNI